MDEFWVRALLVASVVICAASWSFLRRGPTNRSVEITGSSFEPGIYLFSSDSCSTCPAARSEMLEALGENSFTEIIWQRDPELFEIAGVDSVPAVMIVDGQGGVRLRPGHPDPSNW